MMYQTSLILTLQSNSQTAIEQSIQHLDRAGFQVVRSFDLQVARSAHGNCSCPHHGTQQCDCQMVVLLVYGEDDLPATLVLHGQDGETQISMVDTLELRPPNHLIKGILQALLPKGEQGRRAANFRLEGGTYAA